MEEKQLFIEIPGSRNDFHSAILTSFTFDFHHFEYQVLRSLRQKYITNVAVFVDYRMLDEIIGITTGNLKHVSQSYSVNGIISKGAFHPKVNFLIGDNKLLMFIGSGNITPGGHGKNHELFTGFYADNKETNQLPILIEAWTYLQTLVKDIPGYNLDRIDKIISTNSNLRKSEDLSKHLFYRLDENTEVALLYNESSSIFSQIISLIPKEGIKKITIVSPYFDENGETLISLLNYFNESELDVFLPKQFGLPPNRIGIHNQINFYSWEETDRAQKKLKGKIKYFRKIHSKIFHFKSAAYEYCIIGSANATIKGFGRINKAAANEEFCVLYRTTNTGFLDQIGITGIKHPINPNSLKRVKNNKEEADENDQKAFKIYITGAEQNGINLKVYIKNPPNEIPFQFSLFDDSGKIAYSHIPIIISTSVIIKLNNQIKGLNLSSIAITDITGNVLSNRQIINNLDKLYNTDPTKTNRTFNQILNAYDVGTINEFELIDYLNEMNQINSNNVGNGSIKQGKSSEIPQIPQYVQMNYEQAFEATKNKINNYEKIINEHRSIRLVDTIIQRLKRCLENTKNEIIDEEEIANSEKSNIRNETSPKKTRQISEEGIRQIILKQRKLVDFYTTILKKFSSDPAHEVDLIDLSEFLLVTHVVTAACIFNSYEFKEKEDDRKKSLNLFDKKFPKYNLHSLKVLYIELMKEILTDFSKLIVRHSFKDFSDNEHLLIKFNSYVQKMIYNSTLYFYLIEINSTEPAISEGLDILSLNLYNYVHPPDEEFEQFITDSSKSGDDLLFSYPRVIEMKNKRIALFNTWKENKKYNNLDHSGFCHVLHSDPDEIQYSCAFGTKKVSKNDFKKHIQKT